jgi:hypothetical protein
MIFSLMNYWRFSSVIDDCHALSSVHHCEVKGSILTKQDRTVCITNQLQLVGSLLFVSEQRDNFVMLIVAARAMIFGKYFFIYTYEGRIFFN